MEAIGFLASILILVGMFYIPYKIYKVFNDDESKSNIEATDWKCPKCKMINNVKGSTVCFCGYTKNEPQNNKLETTQYPHSASVCNVDANCTLTNSKIQDKQDPSASNIKGILLVMRDLIKGIVAVSVLLAGLGIFIEMVKSAPNRGGDPFGDLFLGLFIIGGTCSAIIKWLYK